MNKITRLGVTQRWSDVVIHAGVARWVEVAADVSQDMASQTRQILQQIDETLLQVQSDREQILQITIYVADLSEIPEMNNVWDAWVPTGHPPSRVCVQSGLQGDIRVEMVIVAASSLALET